MAEAESTSAAGSAPNVDALPAIRVFATPDYRTDNPYQTLLADALKALGAHTTFREGYRRGFPITRALRALPEPHQVVHLHWIAPHLRRRGWIARRLYAAKLLFDLWLARRHGAALVWTVHNLMSHESVDPVLELRVRRWIAALSDRLIVHDAAAREAVFASYGISQERIAVIPHGHFREAYGAPTPRSDARRILGLTDDRAVVLFFGMIRPYKGVLRLIEVWRALSEIHDRALLLIVGDARDLEHAEEVRAAAADTPALKLDLRYVADQEVPDLFGAADFVVLPYERSFTSGVAALAVSFGARVVGPALPAITAVAAPDEHVLYDPHDVVGLAGALVRALKQSSQESRHNAEALRETALTCMASEQSWQSIAALHLSAYRTAIDARRMALRGERSTQDGKARHPEGKTRKIT